MNHIPRVLAAVIITATPVAVVAQTTVTLNATSGSNVIAQSYSTSGGLTLSLGFFAEYLIVGGGGGGGGANSSFFGNGETAGGGGAGGLLTNVGTPLQISNMAYPVAVGSGGAGATTVARGSNGGPSSIFSGTAVGGGGGAGSSTGAGGNRNGAAGGSGGGGGHDGGAGSGGAGTPGQGTAGGAGVQADGTVGSGGGGGGAATSGTNGSGKIGGTGGAGAASTITGGTMYYAGGGGGGGGYGGGNGAGGLGGGGTGRTSGGTVNTGGGGGSGNFAGGAGVVIVRYQGAQAGTGGTVTSGTSTAAGYTLHAFTTTGSSTFDLSGLNLSARLGATVTGVITGSGSLTYNGPGKLILSSTNTYSGATAVSAGMLLIDGNQSPATGAITVAGGATLGGRGTAGGAVTVLANGILSPGASIESLGVGATTFASGSSIFAYEVDSSILAGSGSAADLLVSNGNLSIGTGSTLQFTDLGATPVAFPQGTKFSLISYGGNVWDGGLFTYQGNELSNLETFSTGLNSWEIRYDDPVGGSNYTADQLSGNSVTITAVPEPASLALAGLGIAAFALTFVRSRRREKMPPSPDCVAHGTMNSAE